MTDEQRMQFCAGRLYGLAGTVRYKIEPDLRKEIKEIAQLLAHQEVDIPYANFEGTGTGVGD